MWADSPNLISQHLAHPIVQTPTVTGTGKTKKESSDAFRVGRGADWIDISYSVGTMGGKEGNGI